MDSLLDFLFVLAQLSPCLILLGEVVIQGDVIPAPPEGFGTPPDGFSDFNDDNIVDWIEPAGNNVFTNLINGSNPTDIPDGVGLAWNQEDVWRDYDSDFDVEVGRDYEGVLTINNGTALRCQDLDLGRAGSGQVFITGAGSLYNNAPTIISRGFSKALNYGNNTWTGGDGTPGGTGGDEDDPSLLEALVTDLAGATTSGPDFNFFTRSLATDFHVKVGAGFDPVGPTIPGTSPAIDALPGHGFLQIDNGGRMEVGDAFFVSFDSGNSGRQVSPGTTLIDGAGSSLYVHGRTNPSRIGPKGRLKLSNSALLHAPNQRFDFAGRQSVSSSDLHLHSLFVESTGGLFFPENSESTLSLGAISSTEVLGGTDNTLRTDAGYTPSGNYLGAIAGSMTLKDAYVRVTSAQSLPFAIVRSLNFDSGGLVSFDRTGSLHLRGGLLDVPEGLDVFGTLLATEGETEVLGPVTIKGQTSISEPDDADPNTTEASRVRKGQAVISGCSTTVVFMSPVIVEGLVSVVRGARVIFNAGVTYQNGGDLFVDSNSSIMSYEVQSDGSSLNNGRYR